ncbi:hypothetical protein HDU91_005718, partial [Kappamyces sp. JEL0680]
MTLGNVKTAVSVLLSHSTVGKLLPNHAVYTGIATSCLEIGCCSSCTLRFMGIKDTSAHLSLATENVGRHLAWSSVLAGSRSGKRPLAGTHEFRPKDFTQSPDTREDESQEPSQSPRCASP